jgi:formiminoglutamase
MSELSHLQDFLRPINRFMLNDDEGYKDGQFGKTMAAYEDELPDLENADVVLIGCSEGRGTNLQRQFDEAPDKIRKAFYELYHWHKDVVVADMGNVRTGASITDTYAAMRLVITELLQLGKRVVVLGGSHDLTLAQYQAYATQQKIIDSTVVDALIDMDDQQSERASHFLTEMLTSEPNFIHHHNHIGFQSYYVHPRLLETIDKLRFDCVRVGKIKEKIDELEPVIRNSALFSFDVNAFQQSYMPCNQLSPNGLTGEEACVLMQYAGMSPVNNTTGIYGYKPGGDTNGMGAKAIAQMLWYFVDGVSKAKHEAPLTHREEYNEYHTSFNEVDTLFLQSKASGRWWAQLPNKRFIACSYNDYLIASRNEYPERWLRAIERS